MCPCALWPRHLILLPWQLQFGTPPKKIMNECRYVWELLYQSTERWRIHLYCTQWRLRRTLTLGKWDILELGMEMLDGLLRLGWRQMCISPNEAEEAILNKIMVRAQILESVPTEQFHQHSSRRQTVPRDTCRNECPLNLGPLLKSKFKSQAFCSVIVVLV